MTALQTADEQFATLSRRTPKPDDAALAQRHAPYLRFDAREPFLPSAVGYTIFRADDTSPSFPREITLPDAATIAIEYAIWWDWDMGHLYELEHVWVYLGADEQPVHAEASWHGGFNGMRDADGQIPLADDGRVIVYSEPGKHAFAATRATLMERKPTTDADCNERAGKMGVHVTPLFEGIIHSRNPLTNQVVLTWLERQRFEPTYDFSNVFDLAGAVFVPWDNLFAWIPTRVDWWAQHLVATIPPHERRVLRIAHRGASAYAQESSPTAMRLAAEHGSDLVEVDLRLTADDVPVIAHDSDLSRVFGVNRLIKDVTLDELRALTPPDREPLLTLEELIEVCKPLRIGLYLDIKASSATGLERALDTLKRHHMLRSVVFASFRADWVAEVKALQPDAITSILFSSVHVEPVGLAGALRADYVHPCWERLDAPHTFLTDEWLDNVRAAGLGVICWHEERPDEIAALQQLGVSGICSDQPDLLIPKA